MQTSHLEWVWLDGHETVSLPELSQACGMSTAELDELVEYGALAPLEPTRTERLFAAQCVSPLRTAGRLRQDFDLDLFAVVLVLDYLQRIDTLERQVRSLQARQPRSS